MSNEITSVIKNPVKTAKNVELKNGVKKREKIALDIETASLSPTEGRIICIGVMETNSGKHIAFYDPNEEKMVRRFINYSEPNGFEETIGYNLLFDIRFIFAKCLKYEIPARHFFSLRYTDLMMILKSAGRTIYNFNKPGTLDEWSNFLFGDRKVSDSSTLPLLYQEGICPARCVTLLGRLTWISAILPRKIRNTP